MQVRHFELSNESWKTNQAAQYAWALLDWAPALKSAYPAALMGANGPGGRTEVGDVDQGVAWWPQVLLLCACLQRVLVHCKHSMPLEQLWVQVLGAASSAIDFLAVHPYPVLGWDYLDYVNGRASNLQVRLIRFSHVLSSPIVVMVERRALTYTCTFLFRRESLRRTLPSRHTQPRKTGTASASLPQKRESWTGTTSVFGPFWSFFDFFWASGHYIPAVTANAGGRTQRRTWGTAWLLLMRWQTC